MADGFIWYELVTNDVDKAVNFYKKVVGWDINDSGMPGMAWGRKAAVACRGAGRGAPVWEDKRKQLSGSGNTAGGVRASKSLPIFPSG
jgi:predicted enzyme related to lactoylglutathione lyase